MRTLTVAAGIASVMLPLTAVGGAVLSVGGPLSQNCYNAALSGDTRDLSVDACSRALSEEPLGTRDRAGTLVNRGILQMLRGKDALADADFDSALRIDQSLPDAWLNKGFLRLRRGNGREALPLLQSGIDRGARRQALAIFARGVAYEQMGQFSLAYADLKRAEALDPGWSMPREYLANYRIEPR
jgi:tetratricopeptide (TPR) repeat protein